MANPQLPIGQTEDDDNVFFDLLAAPFRGVEGAVQGVYNLADFVAFDVLPDYDEKFLGKSTTVAGSAVEGISQFMTGFVPIFGWAGRAGNLAKAGSLTQKALSGTVSRGAIAGAVTDFTMFNGQEARLSNFIQQYPELQNPVTEFLAHDEDEGEIEGRIKNVLEGLGLEFAALGFVKGLKSMKRGKKIRAEGGSPEEVAKGMQEPFGGDLASVRPSSPEMLDHFDNEIIDEWDKHLDMEADHDEVISALGKFKPKYRSFLKALAKEDWLGFDYPAQAVDQFIRNPNVYDEFEVSPALKAAATKLQNAGFRGDLASVKGIVAYHGGTAGKTFEAQAGGDLGFHFGSKEAAQERISRVGGKGEVQEYVLDINNPLRLNDPISFRGRGEGGRKFKQELKDAGIDVDVSKDYSREELTQLIKDKGYDGIVYKNAAEGVKEGKLSDSYVALDADQIKQSDGLGQETFLRRSGIFANRIDDSTMRLIREGIKTETQDGTTYFEVSQGKAAPTVDNVLKSLSRNAKYPEVKELAKNLRKIIKDTDDKNVLVTASDTNADPSKIRGGAKGEIAGMYSPKADRVVLFPSADEQTLVHELLHGVTSRKLNAWVKSGGKDRSLTLKNIDNVIKNRKAPKPIRELAASFKEAMQEFKRLEKSGFAPTPEGKTLYAFKDLDEFLVAAFTDYDLQKILRRMPSKDNRTVFQKIVDAVKDMLGYSHRADGSLLDKVLRDSAQIISAGRPEYVGKARITKRSNDGMASVKGGFIDEVSPEHAGIAKAIARGETVTLPRFETTDQQHSFIEALRKEVESNPTTMERMKAEAEAGLPIDFGDNTITDRFKNMEQTVQNQRQVRLEATIYKKVGAGLVKKLHDIAQEYTKSGGGDLVTAKLKNAFQEVVGFSEQYFRLGRETSLALGGRRQRMGRRKLGLSESEMKGQGIRKNFVNENGGMSVEKIVKAIEEGVDPNNFEAGINGMFSLSRKSQGRKFLDVPTEYWINSILSGPRTQVVNVMGNALTSVWSTLETAVGGVLTGNLEVTRQAFAAWADMSMFKEAASFAKNAAKSGENLLDPDARAFNEGRTDAITPEAFGKVEGESFYKTIKFAGDFFRLPSRLLMTTDEFFKQLNYRRAARFKLAMDGIQQGISEPRQLAEYIEKGLEDVITAGGRHYSEESLIREGTKAAKDKGITDSAEEAEFVEQYVLENKKEGASALADFALEEARYLTFTKDLERGTLGSAIQGATQAWSPLRFVMPFVRTPTNILAFAFERTPGVFMPGVLKEERKRLLEAIKGNDPIAKSQATGKLATCAVMGAVFLDTIVNNREYITGGGPKNEAEKKALRATGWQPYSFKIDGKYYSYQRLDPLGTILGVGADLVDQGIRAPRDFDQSGLDKVFSALTLTFVRNVTNKSYLSGVQMFTDAMADPERYGDRLLRNFGSSMLPYSGFLGQVQYGMGTQEAREVRSLADAVLNKLPSGRNNLDPKRNILGESIMIENKPLIGAISPIAMSAEKNDPILTEMANLNHAFRPPPSTYGGLIDLLAFENDQGRTAHDRRQEKLQTVRIGGRTLRQALQRLIASRNYQRLPAQSEPGLPSPRVQKITSLLTKYRTKALNETMTEFPELSQYYDQVSRAKTQYRQGADHSSVLSLLTTN